MNSKAFYSLQCRHNERDGLSNYRRLDGLLNSLFRRRSKKTSSSSSLAFVRGIQRWSLNSPHKRPVKRKMFLFDGVIMFQGPLLALKLFQTNHKQSNLLCIKCPLCCKSLATGGFTAQRAINLQNVCLCFDRIMNIAHKTFDHRYHVSMREISGKTRWHWRLCVRGRASWMVVDEIRNVRVFAHICGSKITIIGSDNGLSPCRCQASHYLNQCWNIVHSNLRNFSEILSEIHTFSIKKMYFKMSSGKWLPFCLDLNELTLAQVMVSHHYLKQRWYNTNWTHRNKLTSMKHQYVQLSQPSH